MGFTKIMIRYLLLLSLLCCDGMAENILERLQGLDQFSQFAALLQSTEAEII